MEGKANFKDARSLCDKANGTLAMPRNPAQFQKLQDLFSYHNMTNYYIDVVANETDPSAFFYNTNEKEVPRSRFWAPNEPNGDAELCVTMEKQSNFFWHDVDCSRKEYFACQFLGYCVVSNIL